MLSLAGNSASHLRGGHKMPSKLEKFIAKTGKRGMPDYKEAPGQVMLYSDE